jgi:hypothetical protein
MTNSVSHTDGRTHTEGVRREVAEEDTELQKDRKELLVTLFYEF